MTDEEIAVKLNSHDNEIKSLKHRVSDIEEDNKLLTKIGTAVEVMATNLNHMVEEQKSQGETLKKQSDRIERLEREPADNYKYYKRTIAASVISGIIGILIGFISHFLT